MKMHIFRLVPLLIALVFSSCVSDDESIDAIFSQDLQKIEDYIETVDYEYIRRENIGDTGIALLFTEVVEEGEVAQLRDTLRVDYTGMLLDGTVFDTSIEEVARDNDVLSPSRTYEPYRLVLGVTREISGWHGALSRMKEGEKATALIPSSYGYGRDGQGPIPSNAVLIFELDLVENAPFEE